MWTSKIVGKRVENGALFVDVHFINGDASIARTVDMTGGSLDVLSLKIQSQLDTLNTTDDLFTQIIVGEFTPIIQDVSSQEEALNNLRKAKELVDLGVIDDTDPQVLDALTAVKESINPTVEKVQSLNSK